MIGGQVDRNQIVRLRAPLVDDGRGNQARDWEKATETPLDGWAIDAGATGEDTTNRDGSSTAYTLRGPLEADIEATDRVRLFGETFHVDGGVGRQPGVTARTSHCIVQLIRWEG
ncbi:hypothetical protein [Microbacterium karelineae]|uniref:hypothetical protein n=1 Tax=Microbacterium karelineae TaxID=2654283 RepID=UPI0012E9A0FD|nr:hypothetical protein [Microbacterium karelineae]